MSNYYGDDCSTAPQYSCGGGCPVSPELGRVRSLAYAHKDWTFVDPSNAQEWQDAVAAGAAIILPEISGEFTSSPVTGPGYGDSEEMNMGQKASLKYKDPSFVSNVPFYNSIKNIRSFRVALRTDTKIWMSTATVTVKPGMKIDNGLTSVIDGDIEVVFSQEDLVLPYDIPEGIFTCPPTA